LHNVQHEIEYTCQISVYEYVKKEDIILLFFQQQHVLHMDYQVKDGNLYNTVYYIIILTFLLLLCLQNRKSGKRIAEWKPTVSELPLGITPWTFGTATVKLNLHACHDDEFACSGGSCVPADLRCNQQPGNQPY
jgi:hypothetical protein